MRSLKSSAGALALALLVLSGCGDDGPTSISPESSGTSASAEGSTGGDGEPGSVDPTAGDDATAGEGERATFELELPRDAVAEALAGQDTGSGDDAGANTDLEDLVIDTQPSGGEPDFVLDQPAALACANGEFALDALIDGDDAALADALSAAAGHAVGSADTGISGYAGELNVSPAEARDVVVGLLELCTAAGYEL